MDHKLAAAIEHNTRYFEQLRRIQNQTLNMTPPDPINRAWALRNAEQDARNARRADEWQVKLRFIR